MTPNEEQDLIKKVAEICGLTAKKFGGEKFTQYFHGNTSVYADLFSEDPYSLSALADFVDAWAWEEHEIWLSLGLGNVEPLRFRKSLGAWVKINSKRNSFKRSDPHSKNLAILKAFIEAMEVIDDA